MNFLKRSPLLLFLGLSLGVSAQPSTKDLAPVVTLYSQNNFTGERIVLSAGDKIDDFNFQKFPSGRGANNRISSIRVEGDVEVTLFLYREFSGEQVSIRGSVPRLSEIRLMEKNEGWDNNLSSIVVRELPRRSPPVVSPRQPEIVGPIVRPKSEKPRDREPEYRGPRHERNETVIVVKKAYLDILDREADPAGLMQYVGIVEDRGWSEDRLRNELRRSREYKEVTVPKKINAAYEEILHRKPDSAGLSFYSRQMVNRGWTETRVRDALKRSPEYAQKRSFRYSAPGSR